jgi:cyclopropane fatty-acyl-phospholipid synthase-like methyltransferase
MSVAKADYNALWKAKSSKSNWREYILPNRTDEQFDAEGKMQAEILNKLHTKQCTSLEFGCGIGRVLKHIDTKKRIGVDVCQEFLDKLPEDIIKIKTDGFNLEGVKPNSVKFIYSLMVFQHISKDDHLTWLNTLYSLLSNKGTMLLQFPNKDGGYYNPTGFVNVYTVEELTELMIKAEIKSFEITQGNLVGYNDGLATENTAPREFFVKITK